MRKALFTLLMMVCGMAASAQYFCTEQGKTFLYKVVDTKDKENPESVIKSTVISVDTSADGRITTHMEEIHTDPGNPLAEIKSYISYTYNPATDVTTEIAMTADDFKKMIVETIKQAAYANNQHISEMELNDLENAMSAKGNIEFAIDPKAEVGSKIPNSSLRLNAGQLTMTMNFWNGKFLGAETITTDAGTFDCLKISYEMRSTSPEGAQKQNITAWYAKGVGEVKSVETDKKGNVISEQTLFVIK